MLDWLCGEAENSVPGVTAGS